MANFFLRDIDPEVFRDARARCMAENLRLVDVVCALLTFWLTKKIDIPSLKGRK